MQHPGIELQNIIKEKGLTQRAFSTILGKKISEVNELLKGKRNITIQWDYLLHQALGTPIKYRILKQIDYEYSLILSSSFEGKTIEETLTESDKEEIIKEKEEIQIERISESNQNNQENINTNEEIDNDRLERARIFRYF